MLNISPKKKKTAKRFMREPNYYVLCQKENEILTKIYTRYVGAKLEHAGVAWRSHWRRHKTNGGNPMQRKSGTQ